MFGDFVHIGIGEHGTALSQQGADSGLFLFHSSVMAVAQASGEVGTDSVVCIRASGYPKTLQALHPLRKKLSTFRFSIRLESDIAIFAYFFTEIVNVFFCGKLFRFPRLSFYCRVDRNRLKRFSAISDWWMCFALFPNSGMGCLIMFTGSLQRG